jgi:hypothetical protein
MMPLHAAAAVLLAPHAGTACDCTPSHRMAIKPLCLIQPATAVPWAPGHLPVITPEEAAERIANRGEPALVVRSSNRNTAGIILQLNAFGAINADTQNAMQLAADYVAGIVNDPILFEININFGPGSLGGTAPALVDVAYTQFRSAIRRDADADDTIQDLLPGGSIPVRMMSPDGPVESARILTITAANAKAVGIDEGGVAIDAEMFIGSLPDGDPTDGIGNSESTAPFSQYSLVDILVHEIGHAMGFINVTDIGIFNPTALDLYRFQRSGPGNPSTETEFRDFPRAIWREDPTPEGQHAFDFIVRSHDASNGWLAQASHFQETGAFPNRIGVMEPSLDPFETGYPDYYSQADLDAFDAIGWDIVTPLTPVPCNPADLADPRAVLDLEDIVAFVAAFGAADPLADLAPPQGIFDLDDIVAFVSAFEAGCP